MSREIPEPVRAVAGLAATVLDEAKKLPETLPGIPVRAVGLAMQAALKLQQQYAGLVARGDELFTGIRGENEPGLATFDDEEDAAPSAPVEAAGYRESAFDRAEVPVADTDETTAAVVDLEEIAEADRALEELAIDDLVDTAPAADAGTDAGAADNHLLEAAAAATATDEGGTPVAAATGVRTDVADSDTTAADAATDAAIAEGAAVDAVGETSSAPTDDPEGGSEVSGSQAAGTAPVDGYDGFSIAQLRGRLRGYAPSTVESLLAYEEATRAREPYLRMLRNRMERLTADAVAASPLAPRGG